MHHSSADFQQTNMSWTESWWSRIALSSTYFLEQREKPESTKPWQSILRFLQGPRIRVEPQTTSLCSRLLKEIWRAPWPWSALPRLTALGVSTSAVVLSDVSCEPTFFVSAVLFDRWLSKRKISDSYNSAPTPIFTRGSNWKFWECLKAQSTEWNQGSSLISA
jgi:hypothetical protein